MTIQEIMKNIISLLKENDEPGWHEYFSNLMLQYADLDTRKEAQESPLTR